MEHPNSKCRIAQAEYLSRLPEEERENKARDILRKQDRGIPQRMPDYP